jgi:hypothetical protein
MFQFLSIAGGFLLFCGRNFSEKKAQAIFGTYKRFTRMLAILELVGG